MRRRSSCLMACNFSRIRSRRDFRLIWNLPRRVLLQIKTKPRKVKVSGLLKPAPLAVFRRKSSELDEPGLLRMKR